MKDKLFALLHQTVSKERIKRHAEEIHRLEGDESFCNYKKSTDYCLELLKDAGFEQVERISLPADGKTVYYDCIMPQAWDTAGRSFLRIEDESLTMEERMIADTEKDPFNIGVWSAPTPEGGIDCEIVDIRITGNDPEAVRGKLVLLDGFTQDQYKFAALSGSAGVIVSDSEVGEEYPDHCCWCNGIGYTGWYLTAEDKRIPVFSVTPRRCAFLRNLLMQKKVTAHAEAKCRIYDGEVYTVTGIIPGESKEEITMIAHLYEPFLPDDAAGGAIIAEIGRSMKSLVSQKILPSFKKTLRVVLSMERYGYAQYYLNKQRNQRTLIVFSFDSCCHISGRNLSPIKINRSSMFNPTFLDLYLPFLMHKFLPKRRVCTVSGTLSDDTFCSDDFIGIPSLWLHNGIPRYHHNFSPAFMYADWDLAYDIAAVMGVLLAQLATGNQKEFRNIRRKCGEIALETMKNKCAIIRNELEEGKISCFDAAGKVKHHKKQLLKQLSSISQYDSGKVSQETIKGINALTRSAIKSFCVPKEGRILSGIQAAADRIVVKRIVPGTLLSMARIPQPERHNVEIPDVLYILFDGKRSVFEAVKQYEYEKNTVFSAEQFRTTVDELEYLKKYGYIKIETRKEVVFNRGTCQKRASVLNNSGN